MKHCYIFECKSVQAYIFSSTRLIDIIAASERLDRVIDNTESSLLSRVCDELNIDNDLLDVTKDVSGEGIQFLRCKGGSIQAVSDSQQTLINFRSLWQITLQQLCPSLSFVDAIGSGDNMHSALAQTFAELGAAQNIPRLSGFNATAVMQRYPRTGGASMPANSDATKNHKESWKGADADVLRHRSAYSLWDIKSNSGLQQRFVPNEFSKEIQFPTNHDAEFNTGEIKDVALLHADGNGLGQLLISLRDALDTEGNEKTYKNVLREFSDVVNSATVNAAKQATKWLFEQHTQHNESKHLPMRPIVLGGDDLTLLVGANYALEYMEKFTEAFECETQKAIKNLLTQHSLKHGKFPNCLTASGAIVFCKLGHPFTAIASLVEQATNSAKEFSKQQVETGAVAPASVTFCRTSTVITSDFAQFMEQVATFEVQENVYGVERLQLAQDSYLLSEPASGQAQTLTALKQLAEFSRSEEAPVSIAKWRQMATHVSVGDFQEAQGIFDRACKLKPNKLPKLERLMKAVLPADAGEIKGWFALQGNGFAQSFIYDLLIADHFSTQPLKTPTEKQAKESV